MLEILTGDLGVLMGTLASAIAVIAGLYALYRARRRVFLATVIVLALVGIWIGGGAAVDVFQTQRSAALQERQELEARAAQEELEARLLNEMNRFEEILAETTFGEFSLSSIRTIEMYRYGMRAAGRPMYDNITYQIIGHSPGGVLVAPCDLPDEPTLALSGSGEFLWDGIFDISERGRNLGPSYGIFELAANVNEHQQTTIVYAEKSESGRSHQAFGLWNLDSSGKVIAERLLARRVRVHLLDFGMVGETLGLTYTTGDGPEIITLHISPETLETVSGERFTLVGESLDSAISITDGQRVGLSTDAYVIFGAGTNVSPDGDGAASFAVCFDQNREETGRWFDRSGHVTIRDGVYDGNGLVYLVGYRHSELDSTSTRPNRDWWFAALNESCQIVEEHSLGGHRWDEFRSVDTDSDGNVVAAGYVTRVHDVLDELGLPVEGIRRSAIFAQLQPDGLSSIFELEQDESVAVEDILFLESNELVIVATAWEPNLGDTVDGGMRNPQGIVAELAYPLEWIDFRELSSED